MREFFHPEVIFVHANFRGRVEGREARVKSYADFSSQVKIHEFRELDRRVDGFGDTAVATHRFEIRHDIGGKPLDETGQDILVFRRQGDKWLAGWRAVVPIMEKAATPE